MTFNSTFRYIDDVLSIINNAFHSYVDSIYPSELEIKDTTESSMSASYLDILLNIDINGKLTTQLYDKRDDFSFSIVNVPYLCTKFAPPALGSELLAPPPGPKRPEIYNFCAPCPKDASYQIWKELDWWLSRRS